MNEGSITVGEIISIENSEGEQVAFEVLFTFLNEINNCLYMVLTPVSDGDEAEVEITALRFEEGEDDISIYNITEEEWEMVEEVFDLFQEHLKSVEEQAHYG